MIIDVERRFVNKEHIIGRSRRKLENRILSLCHCVIVSYTLRDRDTESRSVGDIKRTLSSELRLPQYSVCTIWYVEGKISNCELRKEHTITGRWILDLEM